LAVHRKALNVTVVICNKIHHSVCMCSELFHIQGLAQPGSSQCFSSPAPSSPKENAQCKLLGQQNPIFYFCARICAKLVINCNSWQQKNESNQHQALFQNACRKTSLAY
jgi:hypothetical protein